MIYLNNLHNRNHEALFGPDAFYDLDLGAAQGNLIIDICDDGKSVVFNSKEKTKLKSGDSCIVYSYHNDDLTISVAGNRRIILNTFSFNGVKKKIYDNNIEALVFCGSRTDKIEINRSDCIIKNPGLFMKTGDFKRCSVVINGVALIGRWS